MSVNLQTSDVVVHEMFTDPKAAVARLQDLLYDRIKFSVRRVQRSHDAGPT